VPLTAPPPIPEAVSALVQRHQDGLRSYLRWLGARGDQIDDVAQDTFVAALTGPFHHREEAAAGAWLRTVARRLLARRWRNSERERVVDLDVDLEAAAAVWERHADDGDALRAHLRACLAAMTGRHGDALRWRYGEGLAVAAIGERLGIAAAGAETLLRRTRQLLRTCIERRLQP
jgi:RNA polymerase sigma-70 factor, ECF subfamily